MQLPFDDSLRQIADSMGVALYQRFTLNEASLFLHCPETDIEKLLKQARLEYIQVADKQVEFFGYQLLRYLLASVKG